MRQALKVQLGEKYTQLSFPVFYALDLVQFGVSQKIPEAVRLGEKLLAEADARMPESLSSSVRDMLLDASNQQRYREGMKISGLQNTSRIYEAANKDDYSKQSIFSKDDPYWMDFMEKTRRREDNWRHPSMHAYAHKPRGILGEVMDFDALKAKHDQLMKDM